MFISSTSDDLRAYRQAAHQAVQGLDLRPVDMADWSADGRSGPARSVDRVRECDVLLLLLAHRYGTVPPGESCSIVELEYRAARRAAIPVLAFFVDEQLPWPPEHVEWPAREQLTAFKKQVSRDVSRKVFRGPEELASQVTQALALLMARQAVGEPGRPWPPRARGRVTGVPAQLRTQPDALVEIGTSVDGLPLLLDVRRSHDLSQAFEYLSRVAGTPSRPVPAAMLDSFRVSVQRSAAQAWAAERFADVLMTDGATRSLYVSQFTLSGPFASAFVSLLERPRREAPGPGGAEESDPDVHSVRVRPRAGTGMRSAPAASSGPGTGEVSAQAPVLQSSGGSNRFLGVDPERGELFSVGMLAGRLVEWRPFLAEDVRRRFPSATLIARDGSGRELTCGLGDAVGVLGDALGHLPTDAAGRYPVTARISVDQHDVMRLVAAVAGTLAELHGRGVVHGDLKPHNVLITGDGVTLIDEFGLPEGSVLPGWTPGWSAPEQILGQPASCVADVYPLGMMVGRVLGGTLVGEVRKYRTLLEDGARTKEFDVFYDPSFVIDPLRSTLADAAAREWRALIEHALRFDPAHRPASAAEFAAGLATLIERYPLTGRVSFTPPGALVAAELAGSGGGVARMISDEPAAPVPGRPTLGLSGATDEVGPGARPGRHRAWPGGPASP